MHVAALIMLKTGLNDRAGLTEGSLGRAQKHGTRSTLSERFAVRRGPLGHTSRGNGRRVVQRRRGYRV